VNAGGLILIYDLWLSRSRVLRVTVSDALTHDEITAQYSV